MVPKIDRITNMVCKPMRTRLQTFNVAYPHLRNRDWCLFVVLRASGKILSVLVISVSKPRRGCFETEGGVCVPTIWCWRRAGVAQGSNFWVFLAQSLWTIAVSPSRKAINEMAVASGFGVNESATPSMKPAKVRITKYPVSKTSDHRLVRSCG